MFKFLIFLACLICQQLTSALISTGSSYLAGQIGNAKPEIGELNHKLLHGLLGGVSGGLTSTFLGRSFEDGAVSGALGGVVAETIAEITAPDLTQEAFTDLFMEKAQRSAKWGEFSSALTAFMLGQDVEIASQTALNAVENNYLKTILIAFTAVSSAYEAYQILQTYENEGLEPALKHLGISVATGITIGVVGKGIFQVGKTLYPTLKEAFNASLINKPLLKSGLHKIESKLGSIEQSISKNATKVDLPNISEPWKSKYWTESAEYTFKGQTNKVYKRNDLFDINFVRKDGKTNLESMMKGKAPIGYDGNPVNLHHSLQTMDSPLVEIAQSMHQQHTKIIHINPNNLTSNINRNAFDTWRNEYWKQRAYELGLIK